MPKRVLTGTIVSDKMWQVLVKGSDELGAIGHGWTYSSHPICAAAGVANLELIDEMDLVTNAGEVGAYFRAGLAGAVANHRQVGEVRGDGLMAAVEFLERGVIGRAMPQGDILGFAPPLCLTREEADIVVEKTAEAVKAVLG